jgi:hypothetical protein
VPARELRTHGVLGDIARARSDFRDQYYGIAPHVVDQVDADDGLLPPLVTVGLIDPLSLGWGHRPTRVNRIVRQHPRVVLADLPPPMRRWASERLVPKVLVATQTRALEVIVDEAGRLLPGVPVVTVIPDPEAPWPDALWPDALGAVAALLSSPPVTMVAAQRHLGAALSSDALKLGAPDLLALPLPADRDAWREAATVLAAARDADGDGRAAALRRSAGLMCRAFGLAEDDALVDWWWQRLPAAVRPLA